MAKLIEGEFWLTVHVLLGLVVGEVVLRLKLPELVMRRIVPMLRLNASSGLAVATSFASSKAGAAILSTSLAKGEISEKCCVWSVLMLSLPSYLRRWPSTLLLSLSLAGRAGGIYAAVMLFLSVGRFAVAYYFARTDSSAVSADLKAPSRTMPLMKRVIKTLPYAWVFFAVSYSLVPLLNKSLQGMFTGSVIAASAVVRVNAALTMAGGLLSRGELTLREAVFALLLGSSLGTFGRVLRMNAGYYFGFFPHRTAVKMLALNLLTIAPFIAITLTASYLWLCMQ